MYRYFIITLLFILSAASSSARKWTPETLPMVHLKDATKYVCNPDGILKPATVDSADALLSALERDKGVQTVVVVVKQLEGDDPYSFGMALGKRYGIGDGKQRTGLILILATEDRSYQLLTGNGLEGTIPDAISRRIQNRVMVPELKKGDWDKAISNTLKSIDGYVRGEHFVATTTKKTIHLAAFWCLPSRSPSLRSSISSASSQTDAPVPNAANTN